MADQPRPGTFVCSRQLGVGSLLQVGPGGEGEVFCAKVRADGDDGDGNDHGDDNDQWSLTMILTIVMMMMIMAMMMGTIVMRHTNMTDGTGKEQE